MTNEQIPVRYGVDVNGCPTEDFELADGLVRLRYDDVPESDITTVDGIRVTTPLRTVIDLAADLDATQLDRMVRTCLERRLFSVAEAGARLDRPDMARPALGSCGPTYGVFDAGAADRARHARLQQQSWGGGQSSRARPPAPVVPRAASRRGPHADRRRVPAEGRSGDGTGVAGAGGASAVVASEVRAVGKRTRLGGDACSVC